MPWDPFRDLQALQERLARPQTDAWAPPIDVYETAAAYVVTAEVPGLTRERDRTRARGHAADDSRPAARPRRGAGRAVRFHQVERGRGPFSRTFEFARPRRRRDRDRRLSQRCPDRHAPQSSPSRRPGKSRSGDSHGQTHQLHDALHHDRISGRDGPDRTLAHRRGIVGRRADHRRRRRHRVRPPPRGPQSPRQPPVLPDLTSVAQRVVGSVTNISSTQIVRGANSPFENDPFFRYFFGDDDPFGNRERARAEPRVRGDRLGRRLPAHQQPRHRRRGRPGVGRARRQARDAGQGRRRRRVDRHRGAQGRRRNLPVLPWGDSSKLKVAEWVLAIGNPFQLNQTVTLGIVSATGRSLEGRLATYEDFIQTDAAINPGNSGGALINARGELVGINTAIYSESGGYQGIGFAVPSNLAQHVMEDLIKFGEVRRGTIPGIKVQPMTTADRPAARGAERARRAGLLRRPALRRLSLRPPPRRHHRRLQRLDGRGHLAVHPPAVRRADRHDGHSRSAAPGQAVDRQGRRHAGHRRPADQSARVVNRVGARRAAGPDDFRPDTAALPTAAQRHAAPHRR